MLAAFRDVPGNCSHVVRETKVWIGTAKKAWEKGWPERSWPPIKDVIKNEQLAARQHILDAEARAAYDAKRQDLAEKAEQYMSEQENAKLFPHHQSGFCASSKNAPTIKRS